MSEFDYQNNNQNQQGYTDYNQQYYNQQYGYQQYPQNPPYAKPSTNLVWAILTTLLCCLPFGVVSIVYAAKVDSLWYSGNYYKAKEASRKARTWAIVSACVGAFWVILYIIIVVVALLSEGSSEILSGFQNIY